MRKITELLMDYLNYKCVKDDKIKLYTDEDICVLSEESIIHLYQYLIDDIIKYNEDKYYTINGDSIEVYENLANIFNILIDTLKIIKNTTCRNIDVIFRYIINFFEPYKENEDDNIIIFNKLYDSLLRNLLT